MKISTKSRYALRLCLDLAETQKDGWVALKDIAERQGVSKKYLEQIVTVLNKAGLLLTSRGFMGGYRLAKDPKDISLSDILRATETSICLIECLKSEQFCERSRECVSREVWGGLMQVVEDYCRQMTLQKILERKNARAQSGEPVRFFSDVCSQN